MKAEDYSDDETDQKKLYPRLIAVIFSFVILVLFLVLLTWLILRPQKPHFILQDATVYAFNLSSLNFLTSNLQITITSRNPNTRIGIYYDKIGIYASYRNQQITLPTMLPATYQGHKDITVWSPFVNGNSVPMAPSLAIHLNRDQIVGTVLIDVKINGRIRWRVGAFTSGRYHLNVNCPAYINFGNKFNGIAVGPTIIKYQLIMSCRVDV